MSRKFAGAFFLVIIFFNLFGFYLSFFINRDDIKKSIKEELSSQANCKSKKLVLSLAEYHAALTAETDEIIIQGAYYDVTKVCVNHDTVTVFVVADNNETNLVNDFVALLTRNNSEGKSQQKNVLCKIFQLEFNKPELSTLFIFEHSKQEFNVAYVPMVAQPTYSTLSPPPDLKS